VNNTQDKILTCSDCGQQFTFTASEQEFFAKKGFTDPSRCPNCRAARKAARSGGSDYHGIFGNDERLPGDIPLPDSSVERLLSLARTLPNRELVT